MARPDHFSKEVSDRNYLASQLLGAVVLEQFPSVLLVKGGLHSVGFYYDFVFEQPITESLLDFIEVQLKTLIKEDIELDFPIMMRENAQSFFDHSHQYLLGIQAGQDLHNVVSLIRIKKFLGLCPELSLKTTIDAGFIKLLEVVTFFEVINGEEFKVTRIVGVSKEESKSLKNFLKAYDVLFKKKDHRKLGPELKFFQDSNLGVTWLPKGIQVRSILQEWIMDEGFHEKPITTPWASIRSRHSLFTQHLNFFKTRDLEKEERSAATEMSLIGRECPSEEKWGLLSSSSWLTEQTTIVCLGHQLLIEFISSLHFIERISTILGFEGYWIWIVPRKKSSKKIESEIFKKINHAIQAESFVFPFSDLQEKEDVLEGFQLEFRVRDSVNREWTFSQLMFKAFVQETTLLSPSKNEENSHFVLARSIVESWDRWIALLIEHYNGQFPLWLAPEQVRIIVIGKVNHEYALEVKRKMDLKKIRVELDFRSITLGEKIHEAKEEKIPYLILIGENERKKQSISLCLTEGKNKSQLIELEPFIDKIYQESLSPFIKGDKA